MTKPLTYEIRVTFKGQLPMRLVQLLGAQFTAVTDVQTAISRTSLAGVRSYEDHAKFAEDIFGRISIFIVEDAHTLIVHTEKALEFDADTFNLEVSDLKKHAKQRIESLHRFAKSIANKILSAQVAISIGTNPIYFAEESSFRSRLNSKGKSNMAARLSMPVASTVVGFAMTQRPEDVMRATIAGVTAALVSVFVEAYSEDRLKYEAAP